MTALLGLLISLTLLSYPLRGRDVIHNVSASQEVNFIPAPTFTDSTFTVQNKTSVNVGWVTISVLNSTAQYINVTGEGSFGATLINYPTEMSIHGHSFGEGSPVRIIIDAHTSVRATWTTSVLVLDDQEDM